MSVPFKPEGYTAITPWIIGEDTAGLVPPAVASYIAEHRLYA